MLTRYLRGDETDEVYGRYRAGEGLEYYLADRLYSIRDRATAKGLVTNHVDYSAFGKVVAETGVGDRSKFTGREYDAESEIYHYRARSYDPALGRFMQQDPLGFGAGDVNLYRYVGNSPTNGRDPSGEMAIANTSMVVGLAALIVATQANDATVSRKLAGQWFTLKWFSLDDVVQWARKGISMQLEVYAETSRFGLPAGKNAITAFAAIGIIMKLANKDDVKEIKNPDGSVTAEASEQLDPVTKAKAEIHAWEHLSEEEIAIKDKEHADYDEVCKKKPPPGLKQSSICDYRKWIIKRDKECIPLRRQWDARWWPGRHDRHIQGMLMLIEEWERWIDKYC